MDQIHEVISAEPLAAEQDSKIQIWGISIDIVTHDCRGRTLNGQCQFGYDTNEIIPKT